MSALLSYVSENKAQNVFVKKRSIALSRQEIRTQLFALVDPETVLTIPRKELLDQVSFVVGELLRRNSIEMHNGEMAAFAEALADDLVSACSGKYSLRQKLI
ncbi:MAG: hypothetical protein IH995_07730 [Proteobacteria bacterium]|nr:hypothetical protein [Pseudomonadota bacterium]